LRVSWAISVVRKRVSIGRLRRRDEISGRPGELA
jgi:hypothetical protein